MLTEAQNDLLVGQVVAIDVSDCGHVYFCHCLVFADRFIA
jgi:hypothetical protein